MPFLRSLPRGFSACLAPFDSLDAPQQRVRAEGALLALFGHQTSLSSSSALPERTEQALHEALLFLYRCAEDAKVSPEDFLEEVSLLTPLQDASVQRLAKLWSQKSKYAQENAAVQGEKAEEGGDDGEAAAEEEEGLVEGEQGSLVGIDWVLGVSMTSSSSKRVQQPFVCLNIKVAAGGGKVDTHALEMTIPEFQKFKQHMEDVGAALDRS